MTRGGSASKKLVEIACLIHARLINAVAATLACDGNHASSGRSAGVITALAAVPKSAASNGMP